MISIKKWHRRFQQQAQWSKEVRKYLFKKANISKSSQIVEIGSGTGATLNELKFNNIYGIDLDFERLNYSNTSFQNNKITCADAYKLPFRKDTFDHTFCHYLLLWVSSPHEVLKEMVRIIKPGGKVLIIAEPDYSRRIDKPEMFRKLGNLQTNSLISQGADPYIGNKLKKYLSEAGLKDVETKIINYDVNLKFNNANWNLEWDILFDDLNNIINIDELRILKKFDMDSWKSGQRVLFIPTYYGIGTKPIL